MKEQDIHKSRLPQKNFREDWRVAKFTSVNLSQISDEGFQCDLARNRFMRAQQDRPFLRVKEVHFIPSHKQQILRRHLLSFFKFQVFMIIGVYRAVRRGVEGTVLRPSPLWDIFYQGFHQKAIFSSYIPPPPQLYSPFPLTSFCPLDPCLERRLRASRQHKYF